MNIRNTKQRTMIKEFLMTRTDHPTADVVFEKVRKTNPNISLGTVYRNLTVLADIGEIDRLKLGDGVDHFDANTSKHFHFICKKCGCVQDIFDFDESTLPTIKNFEGQIEGHVTYFYGTCEHCLEHKTS
ncbi:MAG: transcriptional repressor [Lachnospiraceae bacterium]|nr:transcriptional repressor [Lachnospiraceae bacterium]